MAGVKFGILHFLVFRVLHHYVYQSRSLRNVRTRRRDSLDVLKPSIFSINHCKPWNVTTDGEEMRQYFKELKREMASATARGEVRVKTGKDPLSFDLYRYPCERLLQYPAKDMIFTRIYMIVAWNLMCRSANAFGIRHAHIEWSGDALCV
ncbi:hypothetical protein F442_16989 [Phytophthora nicotianae P10297]|uniref:Uncharacterized protein n=1 Tax=Phytophthora nicotianae P10297 TaxID=1317064 RepID=W2YIM7_PHYNI|nr:hypothetical protein F442_16989 [Phytophthora nicotianae P10297]